MAELEIGVIVEDKSDYDVIDVLCKRVLVELRHVEPGAWRTHRRCGEGCSNLRRKAAPWLADMAREGFHAAIIVHDLDRNPLNGSLNDIAALRRELSAIRVPDGLLRHICIPVEEIEAWFFSSAEALRKACGSPQQVHPSPHLIERPKERLIALSRDARKRPRHSTNDNYKLAEKLELAECARRCPAFDDFKNFLLGLMWPRGRARSSRTDT